MSLRCVYTDLDGTLLGHHGSLFRDWEGNFSMRQARMLEACHRAGIEVVPWTANKPRDWSRLIDAGVDAIITDDPAELIKYLKVHRPKERSLTKLSRLFRPGT